MEPPIENERYLVIKVKYGGTLKRFGAYVHGQSLDHNMNKFKAKIISLFKFAPDADLILTYTDEDGDVVTLDDDDELHDAAISQRLNPLRINVQLKNCARSDPKSQTAISTSIRSSHLGTRSPQTSSAMDEALKSVPEPYHGALSMGTGSGDPSVSDERKASTDPLPRIVLPTTNSGIPIPKYVTKQNANVNMTPGPGDIASTSTYLDLDPSKNPYALESLSNNIASTSTYLDLDPSKNPYALESLSNNNLLSSIWTNNVELEKKGGDAPRDGKINMALPTLSEPHVDQIAMHTFQNFVASKTSISPNHTYKTAGVSSDDNNKQFPVSATLAPQLHNSQFDVHYNVGASIPEVPLPSLVSFSKKPYSYQDNMSSMTPSRMTHSCYDNTPCTFQRGVCCDGCGTSPIMGPRFKSNVKEDYDLCTFCFAQVGNKADYTRIEQAPYDPLRVLHPLFRYRSPLWHSSHGYMMRPSRENLGSSFVRDVTVLDGSVMLPCTSFTKIWRMRNNGTIAWPCGTRLAWTGGTLLGHLGSADLKIPLSGLPVDQEFDIAVDLVAPSVPGSYISYWRMESPSFVIFGEQIWVQIQVEYPRANSAARSFHGDLNLNLPPEFSGGNGLGNIDASAGLFDIALPKFSVANTEPESLVSSIPTTSVKPVMAKCLSATTDGQAQIIPGLVPSASDPITDVAGPSSVVDVPQSGATTDNTMEQTLLKELEEMGFKQIDLNKEVLMQNDYDLDQSVYDLCACVEWEPLLDELQEMGFHDKKWNRRLLVKNGGSVEQVVLDLLAGDCMEVDTV